jgi:hypothetical protein
MCIIHSAYELRRRKSEHVLRDAMIRKQRHELPCMFDGLVRVIRGRRGSLGVYISRQMWIHLLGEENSLLIVE